MIILMADCTQIQANVSMRGLSVGRSTNAKIEHSTPWMVLALTHFTCFFSCVASVAKWKQMVNYLYSTTEL